MNVIAANGPFAIAEIAIVSVRKTHFFLIDTVASFVLWAEEIRKFFARRQIKHHLNPTSP